MSGAGTVTPFDATTIPSQFTALGTEAGTLAVLATSISGLAAKVEAYQNNDLYNAAISNANILKTGLKRDVIDALSTQYNKAFKDDDMIKSLKTLTTTFIVLSLIIFVAFMIAVLVLLCLYAKKTSALPLWMKILAQFFLIVQQVFGIIVLILGIALIFTGVYVFFGCEIMNGVITQRDYMKNNLPKSNAEYPAINPGANECVFKQGTGFLINALGSDTTYINLAYIQLENVITGSTILTQLNVANAASPILAGTLRQQITDHIAYTNVPRDDPSAQDITQATVSFNAKGCKLDVLAVKDCPAGFQASTAADPATTAVGSNYCIRYPTKPASYTTRYAS